jgi:hypothetical protein
VFLLCFCFFFGVRPRLLQCTKTNTRYKKRMSDDRSLALRLLAARVTSAGREKLESVFGTVATVAPGASSEDAPEDTWEGAVIAWVRTTASLGDAFSVAAVCLGETDTVLRTAGCRVALAAAVAAAARATPVDVFLCSTASIGKVLTAIALELNSQEGQGAWRRLFAPEEIRGVMHVVTDLLEHYVPTLGMDEAFPHVLHPVLSIVDTLTVRGYCCDEDRAELHTEAPCVPGASFAAVLQACCSLLVRWTPTKRHHLDILELLHYKLVSHRCVERRMRGSGAGAADIYQLLSNRFTSGMWNEPPPDSMLVHFRRQGLQLDWKSALRWLRAFAPTRSAYSKLQSTAKAAWQLSLKKRVFYSTLWIEELVQYVQDYLELFGDTSVMVPSHLQFIGADTPLGVALATAPRWKPARRMWLQTIGVKE